MAVYDSYWRRWLAYCRDKSVNPHHPMAIEVSNFLSFLAGELKLSTSSVRGHRAAICTTILEMGGPDFSANPLLGSVVKGVAAIETRTPNRTPAWHPFLV